MKSTDLRAKARAIFGSAIAEPMPNQPNGAKALQQRANARPIPTYKVGGVVKSTPPGPTAAERAASKAQDERLKKAKVTPKEGKVIDSANRSEGMYKKGGKAGCYSEGGRMKGSTDSARMKGSTDAARMKGSTDSARMSVTPDEKRKKITLNEKRVRVPSIEYKDGGKAKSKPKDGLAVMIAIGKPMKGMKKPVKKAMGGKMDANLSRAIGNAKADMARQAAAPRVDPTNMPAGRGSMLGNLMGRSAAAKMGSPVKRAVGGAGKTRKGMCK
jgi:hypothetical protein